MIRSCIYGAAAGSQQSDGRSRDAPETVSRGGYGRVGRLRPLSRKGGSEVPPRRKFLNFISKMVHFRAFGGKLSNAIEMADTAV